MNNNFDVEGGVNMLFIIDTLVHVISLPPMVAAIYNP